MGVDRGFLITIKNEGEKLTQSRIHCNKMSWKDIQSPVYMELLKKSFSKLIILETNFTQ